MVQAGHETEARFAAIVREMGKRPGVTHCLASGKGFGHSALKVHDKIFAMISSAGHFVVKLPKARVDALVSTGVGQRFDANRGRPMNEWLEVHSQSSGEWFELAREALDFVGT